MLKSILKIVLFTVVTTMSIVACTDSEAEKKAETAALKQILDIHDEVMPQMSVLAKAESALEESIKNPAMKSKLPELEAKLKQNVAAQDAMMDWMANFKEDFKDMKHTEIMSYLAAEKAKVDAMKIQVVSELKNNN